MPSTNFNLLQPAERAEFAVSSRLLSCLVTESLLRALYLPIGQSSPAAGLLIILSRCLISEHPDITRALQADDILAIVPLHHPPILQAQHIKHGSYVTLVDPLDMLPQVYEVLRNVADTSEPAELDGFESIVISTLKLPPWTLGQDLKLKSVDSPIQIWRKFVKELVIQDQISVSIENELSSSVHWQKVAYENPPACPLLSYPSIKWEQSLVEGHPTHPMHRARASPSDIPSYNWYEPTIRFVRVPRINLDLLGAFDVVMGELAYSIAHSAGQSLPLNDSSVIMPVHELQLDVILAKFPYVEALHPKISFKAAAQSSVRTVVVPTLPGMALKLAVGVKISSSLRTISHYTANFGPRFSRIVVPKLSINPEILTVEREPASAVSHEEDPDLAKHFTAILRECYKPKCGENVIVCAALLESGHDGIPTGLSVVEHVLRLDTTEKKVAFLDRYIQLAVEAFVPPLLHNGVAFEAHAQNVLARFDIAKGQLLGFVVRDLGGLRIHPPSLEKSTGIDFEFLDGHCVVTKTAEEAYPKFYHTLIHNHLQRLIRLLGFHYNGIGWEMLRRHLTGIIPSDHGLFKAWLSPDATFVSGKCLMRMRLQDYYRDMVYSPFPNLIQYRGVDPTE